MRVEVDSQSGGPVGDRNHRSLPSDPNAYFDVKHTLRPLSVDLDPLACTSGSSACCRRLLGERGAQYRLLPDFASQPPACTDPVSYIQITTGFRR
jgi:hypothetical protein